MKNETQVKDEIILVVKEAIRNNTSVKDIDDTAELDSNDVDHIAEAVADRLYADGWRKENRELYGRRNGKQIATTQSVIDICKKSGVCVVICTDRTKELILKELQSIGYCKQSDTARKIIKDILWTVENCTKEYLRRYLRKIAEEYGVKREDL